MTASIDDLSNLRAEVMAMVGRERQAAEAMKMEWKKDLDKMKSDMDKAFEKVVKVKEDIENLRKEELGKKDKSLLHV